MSTTLVFIIIIIVTVLVLLYRFSGNDGIYKYVQSKSEFLVDKFAPYSYKEIQKQIVALGQNYSPSEYVKQIFMFGGMAVVIAYLYFHSLVYCMLYAVVAIAVIPYLSYLRSKRLYSEYIFEQIQVYTTNTIMEFATVQSFVKALEGVYESGVLEDPVKTDVKVMIDMAYENGTINESIEYMNEKYNYHIVRNMHQLFIQITNEGALNSSESLENMSLDIDMLVESVYHDRVDRADFHKKFVKFGIILYFMVVLIQIILGQDTYITMLKTWYVQLFLHMIVLVNSYFLLKGEIYYNENVGAE